MPRKSSKLAETVRALRPFVPAKKFDTSKRFYSDLGFSIESLGDALAEVRLGRHWFLLQDYFVEQWAGNFVAHAC